MNAAYTIAVTDGNLTCRQRIELEVRIAGELERLLGGPAGVVAGYRAAVIAQETAAGAQRWKDAVESVSATVRRDAAVADLQFQVRLDHAAEVVAGS